MGNLIFCVVLILVALSKINCSISRNKWKKCKGKVEMRTQKISWGESYQNPATLQKPSWDSS